MFPFTHGVIASINSQASNPLWNDLYAAYNFDNNVLDLVGSNDGTLQSGATYTASGKINDGLSLDSINDYLLLPDNSLNFSGDFTVSIWFYSGASTSGYRTLVNSSAYNAGYTRGHRFTLNNGKLNFQIWGNDNDAIQGDVTGATTIAINTWYMATAVRRGNDMEVYLNAVSDATPVTYESPALYHATNYCSIGATKYSGAGVTYFFDGYQDVCHIWNNRALSTGEITELYNGGSALQYS